MKRLLLTSGILLAAATTALAQTTGNDAVAEVSKETSLLGMVAAAGWVMIPLALASMLTVTLIIYCFFTLTEKSITTPELLERMEPFFENEDVEGLAQYVAERPQATARIVDRTLIFLERHPDADADSIGVVAEDGGQRASPRRSTSVCSTSWTSACFRRCSASSARWSASSIRSGTSPIRRRDLDANDATWRAACRRRSSPRRRASPWASRRWRSTLTFRGRVGHLVSVLEGEATLLTQEIIMLSRRHRVTRVSRSPLTYAIRAKNE